MMMYEQRETQLEWARKLVTHSRLVVEPDVPSSKELNSSLSGCDALLFKDLQIRTARNTQSSEGGFTENIHLTVPMHVLSSTCVNSLFL